MKDFQYMNTVNPGNSGNSGNTGKQYISDLLKSRSFATKFNKYFNSQHAVISFILSSYYLELKDIRKVFDTLSRYVGKISFVNFYIKYFKNQTLQEFCMAILKMRKYQQFDDMIIKYLEEVLELKLYDDFNEIYNEFLEELWKSDTFNDTLDKIIIYTELVDCDNVAELYKVLDGYYL